MIDLCHSVVFASSRCICMYCSFFFNDTATTEIYTYCHTLALHDALPICSAMVPARKGDAHMKKAAAGVSIFLLCATSTARAVDVDEQSRRRSEEHTSELQSLMRISYAVFCLKKKSIKQSLRVNT